MRIRERKSTSVRMLCRRCCLLKNFLKTHKSDWISQKALFDLCWHAFFWTFGTTLPPTFVLSWGQHGKPSLPNFLAVFFMPTLFCGIPMNNLARRHSIQDADQKDGDIPSQCDVCWENLPGINSWMGHSQFTCPGITLPQPSLTEVIHIKFPL